MGIYSEPKDSKYLKYLISADGTASVSLKDGFEPEGQKNTHTYWVTFINYYNINSYQELWDKIQSGICDYISSTDPTSNCQIDDWKEIKFMAKRDVKKIITRIRFS